MVEEISVKPSLIDQHLPNASFADCFSLTLTEKNLTIEEGARRVFERSPKWIEGLLGLRNLLMRPFGLQGTVPKGEVSEDVIGFFPVVARSADELVLGFDDKHLDFRVIVTLEGSDTKRISTATLVKTHNLGGRIYMLFVKPFHRLIVPTMLKQVNQA